MPCSVTHSPGGVALLEHMKSTGGATASESSEKQCRGRYTRSAIGLASALIPGWMAEPKSMNRTTTKVSNDHFQVQDVNSYGFDLHACHHTMTSAIR